MLRTKRSGRGEGGGGKGRKEKEGAGEGGGGGGKKHTALPTRYTQIHTLIKHLLLNI